MTGISFNNETVRIVHAVIGTDRYGNESPSWDDPVVVDVPGCRVQPAPSTEVLDRVTRRWLLFAPTDTDLTAADRIVWKDVTYDVTGDVRRWESPSGQLAHLEADLTRVEG